MTKCEGQGQPAPYGLAPLEDAWTLPQREAEVLAKGVVQGENVAHRALRLAC
jgi:hypothetical protein